MKYRPKVFGYGLSIVVGVAALAAILSGVYPAQAADKRPNIVMLMTDDTGWNDFGCYSGGSISMVRTSTEHEPTSAGIQRSPG